MSTTLPLLRWRRIKDTFNYKENKENPHYFFTTMERTLGQLLALMRGKLTQEDWAEKSGVSRARISQLENDQVISPRRSTLRKLAECLDDDPAPLYIAAGLDSPPKRPRPIRAQVLQSTMAINRSVDDMSDADQAAYWKARAEMAEAELADMKQAQRHETAVRLVSSAGGRSFNDASAEAADPDYTPPVMVAETNHEYVERAAEASRLYVQGFLVGSR